MPRIARKLFFLQLSIIASNVQLSIIASNVFILPVYFLLQISMKGLISFGNDYQGASPVSLTSTSVANYNFLAGYWADMILEPTDPVDNIWYHVSTRFQPLLFKVLRPVHGPAMTAHDFLHPI
jgi:hypothetical protein